MTESANGTRKILIFFVSGKLNEAYEAIFGPASRTIRLIMGKQVAEVADKSGYEIFQLKRGENVRHLVMRIFSLDSADQVENYSNPRELYRALEEAVGHPVTRER